MAVIIHNYVYEFQVLELSLVGGGNVKDCVDRVMSALMTVDLLSCFNRTGANGKRKFKDVLEPLVKRK